MEDAARVHVIPDDDDDCQDDDDNQQQTTLADGITDAWGPELMERFYLAGECLRETGAAVICGEAYRLQMQLQLIEEQQNKRELDELDDEYYNSGFHKRCCVNNDENGTRCSKRQKTSRSAGDHCQRHQRLKQLPCLLLTEQETALLAEQAARTQRMTGLLQNIERLHQELLAEMVNAANRHY